MHLELSSVAVSHGDGSPVRLFTLIYAVGTVVTIFMSNDATAVVLTPPSWPPFASDL
jgi:arsenical pump membrane protein